jgi:hypothetical protein
MVRRKRRLVQNQRTRRDPTGGQMKLPRIALAIACVIGADCAIHRASFYLSITAVLAF